MSKMTTAPLTCDSGSNIASSRKSTHPLKTSSRLTLLVSHFSRKIKWKNEYFSDNNNNEKYRIHMEGLLTS